jgi:hypothetical protein
MPTDLQDLLRAKIAELEETAGQLKGLAELKQSIAEEDESEDMRDAIAGLTAANTLKVALDQRTKAKQIAILRHYVLEFGKDINRCAKLSSSLADDDLRKKQADNRGFTASFVVTILNGILSDVAPESTGTIRTVAIWICGLLASAIIGGIVGARFGTEDAVWGVIAGPLVFTCARLWLASGK